MPIYSDRPYSRISSAGQLKAGDQVSWPTKACGGIFQHHAIVVAPKDGNVVKVIHASEYDPFMRFRQEHRSSSGSSGSGGLYSVSEATLSFTDHIEKLELVRYEYAPRECSEPFEVIQKARSKIGRFNFDLETNNCEHFARWCKTGKHLSIQAENYSSILFPFGFLKCIFWCTCAVYWLLFSLSAAANLQVYTPCSKKNWYTKLISIT